MHSHDYLLLVVSFRRQRWAEAEAEAEAGAGGKGGLEVAREEEFFKG